MTNWLTQNMMGEREAVLVENSSPTGALNKEVEAGKSKFLAWAEMRLLPHAMPPSAIVKAIENSHLSMDEKIKRVAGASELPQSLWKGRGSFVYELCGPYLEGHCNLVSILITPTSHKEIPIIPIINLLTKSP